MRWRRRTTYVVEVTGTDPVSASVVHGFYTATLSALRGEAGRVVLDLLSRRESLSPAAKEAAFTLHQLTRADLFATVDRNPFQQVTLNHADDKQWEALLVLAPYAPDLRLEGDGLFTDIFSSDGTLDSVRLRLLPEQLARVEASLVAAQDVPVWLRLRPRHGRAAPTGDRQSRWR